MFYTIMSQRYCKKGYTTLNNALDYLTKGYVGPLTLMVTLILTLVR